MPQVFSDLGVTDDRRLHERADSSHSKLDEIKRKSMEMYGNTKDWAQHNPGKILLGTLATGILVGVFLGRSRR
ncbi:MAG TPA: hypothetical protein VFW45_16800 [Candidatus Polarisedimenticolia bacterium]|nr:hypothetical protein [Candidatus Polarisedimenticolia bacterium]